MFSGSTAQTRGSSASLTQIRLFSRRRLAYPQVYKGPILGRKPADPNDKRTNFKYQLDLFLGKKNYKGEYIQNKYNQIPQNHRPNYITPRADRGQPLVDPKTGQKLDFFGKPLHEDTSRPQRFQKAPLSPFPLNPICETASVVPQKDRLAIYEKVKLQNQHPQDVAIEYNLKITRVEAIAELVAIEKNWESKVSTTCTKQLGVRLL